jgi:ATP-dependent exoDNAse (exonuclease V) alpha subunit
MNNYIELPKLHYDKNSQNVKLMSGMPIIARVSNKKHDIMNNETYTIKKINSETFDIIDGGNIKTFLTKDFQRLFYVAFCITIHKSQGETYNEPYTIHEWERFNARMKYVALSRSTDIKFINIM